MSICLNTVCNRLDYHGSKAVAICVVMFQACLSVLYVFAMPADYYIVLKVDVKKAASVQFHAHQRLVFHGIYILHHSS